MNIFEDLLDLILPRHCYVCRDIITRPYKYICLNCLSQLPKVEEYKKDNEIEKSFWGIVPVHKAYSFFYYQRDSPYNNLIYHAKYHSHPKVAEWLAQIYAVELNKKKFFDDIDLIIPLPLSKSKKRKRGYNQSDYIAQGISSITNIAVDTDCVIRTISNESQTNKTREERWKNVEGIFKVIKPDVIIGRNILLVDDVLTTGATISSCAEALLSAQPKSINILTLSYSGKAV